MAWPHHRPRRAPCASIAEGDVIPGAVTSQQARGSAMANPPTYEVHACKYAHLPRKGHEVQIMADPHDADFPMDYFVWVAIPLGEDGRRMIGGKPIVIDTGFAADVGAKRGRKMLRDPGITLRELGVEPNDIEDVVITHLHYDHVGGW